jgi:hypothetical protein
MSRSRAFLKATRLTHLYLGVFISPALIFFAFTGALQTFSLHETTRGSSYKPPAWAVTLGQIHKKQTPVVPVRRTPPPEARPAGKDHDPSQSQAQSKGQPAPGAESPQQAAAPATPTPREHIPCPSKSSSSSSRSASSSPPSQASTCPTNTYTTSASSPRRSSPAPSSP